MLPPVCCFGEGMMMINAWSMFRLLQNVFNLSETKLPPKSDIIFFGKPYSAKIILHVIMRLSADESFILIDDRELAVMIYNTKVVFIVLCKRICTTYLTWLAEMSWCIVFSFGCVCWKLRHVEQSLCAFQYYHWCLSNKLIPMPGLCFFLFPCGLGGVVLMSVF